MKDQPSATIHNYIPQDRLSALANNKHLPDRAAGSSLFADVSGFTTLTESLRETLGPRRGAEELTKRLEAIFTALIAEVEKYGGSVIGFAGDAMVCWFDEMNGSSSQRAAACALVLQSVMRQFPQLTLKVSIATGPARRLVVGDPTLQLFDVLAGETLIRMTAGERIAQQGEALVDDATARALGNALTISEWRTAENGERFAVIEAFSGDGNPILPVPMPACDLERLRNWIPSWLYTREDAAQGTLFNEFRAVTFLFLRFTGIDYDAESAPAQLNAYLRWVQNIVQQYDGYLRAPTIEDKGSYVLIAFGAPIAHEDDSRRALRAALTLHTPPADYAFITATQIGIAAGVVWAGLYGGATRQSYDFMGDDANLAARLMQAAAPGEILVSAKVQTKLTDFFTFGSERLLQLKGKVGQIPAFAAQGEVQRRGIRLQEPAYSLPMVGRQTELKIIHDKLDLTLQGKAQVIGIVAEAGLGKSRLAAEALRLASGKGFVGYGGGCQSDGVNTPYLAWKPIWNAFFDVDPAASLHEQIRALEGKLEVLAPERLQALPLLGILLNLEIPDNDFTQTLEPKYRQSALRALLVDCLKAGALREAPLLILIEDLHWIDALSYDLLEELARGATDSPVCFVVMYRPLQSARVAESRLEALPNLTRIELGELTASEAAQAIHAKLTQLFPEHVERGNIVSQELVEKLMTRAQGNPFYLEELLNFLHDRGLDPRVSSDLNKIELPDSLHTLIISRIDQLAESEKTALRVASVIGRLFRAAWLTGYYPELGEPSKVKVGLDRLAKLDITPLDRTAQSPQGEPELAYLFKHIVTQEVTYESLPFATRVRLHERLAQYLENQISAGVFAETFLLDALVYHYLRTENHAKQREYLHKAGQAAEEVSAFNTVVDYLTHLVELTPADDSARSALTLKLAEAHIRLGAFTAARAAIAQAQSVATTDMDRAAALALLGEVAIEMGDYAEAHRILAEAVPLARASGDLLTLCRALCTLGTANWLQGDLDDSRIAQEESLALARQLGNVTRELFSLIRLGTVAIARNDLDEAERFYAEVYERAVAVGNRERTMIALGNLATVAYERHAYKAAQDGFQRALTLAREIGSQLFIMLNLINLAYANVELGHFTLARAGLHDGLALALHLGALSWAVAAVAYFGNLAHAQGQTERALALWGVARRHPAWGNDSQHELEITLKRWGLDAATAEAGLAKGAALDWDATIQELLKE